MKNRFLLQSAFALALTFSNSVWAYSASYGWSMGEDGTLALAIPDYQDDSGKTVEAVSNFFKNYSSDEFAKLDSDAKRFTLEMLTKIAGQKNVIVKDNNGNTIEISGVKQKIQEAMSLHYYSLSDESRMKIASSAYLSSLSNEMAPATLKYFLEATSNHPEKRGEVLCRDFSANAKEVEIDGKPTLLPSNLAHYATGLQGLLKADSSLKKFTCEFEDGSKKTLGEIYKAAKKAKDRLDKQRNESDEEYQARKYNEEKLKNIKTELKDCSPKNVKGILEQSFIAAQNAKQDTSVYFGSQFVGCSLYGKIERRKNKYYFYHNKFNQDAKDAGVEFTSIDDLYNGKISVQPSSSVKSQTVPAGQGRQ